MGQDRGTLLWHAAHLRARSSPSRARLHWACRWMYAATALCGSSALFISSLMADAALLTSYGATRLGCPESMLCGCDLPSLHPPCWGSGRSSQTPFSKVLWVLVHTASIYFKSCGRNVTLYTYLAVSGQNTLSYPLLKAELPLLLLAKHVFLLGLSFLLCGIYILMWRRSFSMQMHLTSQNGSCWMQHVSAVMFWKKGDFPYDVQIDSP